MSTWRMNSESRANGLRLSARSFRAFATMSSLGSSITLRATLTTFQYICFLYNEQYCSSRALQGGQDLNLQPAVLETAALPIEPPPYAPCGTAPCGTSET